jgi:hypothetical protein
MAVAWDDAKISVGYFSNPSVETKTAHLPRKQRASRFALHALWNIERTDGGSSEGGALAGHLD